MDGKQISARTFHYNGTGILTALLLTGTLAGTYMFVDLIVMLFQFTP